MKSIIISFLIASSIYATEYAVIFIPESVPADSFATVLENVKETGVDVSVIDSDKMPIWYKKSDTNLTGKVICTRTDALGVKGWKEMPLPQVETRVTKDVRPPDKQLIKVLSRDDFTADYEPVESEDI